MSVFVNECLGGDIHNPLFDAFARGVIDGAHNSHF
jgi:hypothetical protein